MTRRSPRSQQHRRPRVGQPEIRVIEFVGPVDPYLLPHSGSPLDRTMDEQNLNAVTRNGAVAEGTEWPPPGVRTKEVEMTVAPMPQARMTDPMTLEQVLTTLRSVETLLFEQADENAALAARLAAAEQKIDALEGRAFDRRVHLAVREREDRIEEWLRQMNGVKFTAQLIAVNLDYPQSDVSTSCLKLAREGRIQREEINRNKVMYWAFPKAQGPQE